MSPRVSSALGLVLIVAAVAGFVTVADDSRHTGELFAVAGILISGVALLAAGTYTRASSVVALQWLPVGIGLGMLCGAAADKVALGVSLGTALGLLLARVRRDRSA